MSEKEKFSSPVVYGFEGRQLVVFPTSAGSISNDILDQIVLGITEKLVAAFPNFLLKKLPLENFLRSYLKTIEEL